MYSIHQNSQPIKITYYTHPLCRVGWSMQENWERFVNTFGDQMSYRLCIAGESVDAKKGPEPVLSSYTACLAIKAAGQQSPLAEDLYLSKVRDAALSENRDISKIEVLVDIAREVSKYNRGIFDLQKFGKDFDTKATRQAFQADLHKIHNNRIQTFPTFTFTQSGKGVKLTGFCSYQQLVQAMEKLMIA